MNDSYPRSNEILNAFVDDELDAEECQALLSEQVEDAQLANTVCELRTLKELVKAARPNTDSLEIKVSVPKHYYFPRWFAAASIVLVAFSLLFSSLFFGQSELYPTTKTTQIYKNVATLLQAQSAQQDLKLVMHVKLSEQSTATNLFNQLEKLLAYSQEHDRNVLVQVIATGPGVSLLQQGKSPYQDKIRHISENYDNVEFVACHRSMVKQAKTKDININLLPEVLLAHSGKDLISKRQQQGWSTIII